MKIANDAPAHSIYINEYERDNCPGDEIIVPYSAYGVYYPGNEFAVQLSNSTGSFAFPVTIGSIISRQSGYNEIPASPACIDAGRRLPDTGG